MMSISPPHLSTGDTSALVPGPVLGFFLQGQHEHIGESPKEGLENDIAVIHISVKEKCN